MRLVSRHGRRVMCAQDASNRHRPLIIRELIQVAALAAATSPYDVSRNLRTAPHLGRETHRTPPRRAIRIAAIGEPDGNRGTQATRDATRFPRGLNDQSLDAEAVLIGQKRDLETAFVADARLAVDQLSRGRSECF